MKSVRKFLPVIFAVVMFVSCEMNDVEKLECPSPGNGRELISYSGGVAPQVYSYNYNEDIFITTMFNGEETVLAGNIFIPVAKTKDEKFPAIVFMNSWSFDEHQYLVLASHYAKKGYIVFRYSNRGWGKSGGEVSVGGPEDCEDFRQVINWLEDNTPIDMKNIGVTGISLGGGTTLLSIIKDSRVKTVAALSSFVDLERTMFSCETPRLVWGSILVASGTHKGRMSEEVYKLWESTLTNTNRQWMHDWTVVRSPAYYVDDLNYMNKPIYMSQNLGDYLFEADINIDFFNNLTIDHKHMDLNQGTHATGEAMGDFGLPNFAFDNVERWFDYWLKGVDTGIIKDRKQSAEITMEVKGVGSRVTYSTDDLSCRTVGETSYTFPPKKVTTEEYYLGPRTLFKNGTIVSSRNTKSSDNIIVSGLISGAYAGAVVFPTLEQLKIPLMTNIKLLDRAKSVTFEAPVLKSEKRLRGCGSVTLQLSLLRSKGQVILYLYDVDKNGNAKFITHGFYTFWNAVPNKVMEVKIPLSAEAYNIPAGHHLALVVDTNEVMYAKPDLLPFTVDFHFGSSIQSVIKLPFEN